MANFSVLTASGCFIFFAFLNQLCFAYYYYPSTTSRPPVVPRPAYYNSDPNSARLTDFKSFASSASPFTSSSSSSSSSRFHARIAAVMQPPLISANPDKGYEHYEGFCIDLLQRMFDPRQNMTYSIEPSETYGQQIVAPTDSNRMRMAHWSGVIGSVARRQADVAAGAVTITPERRRVVDFTVPILTGHLVVVAPLNPARQARIWSSIKSVADLARQNQINYGILRSGSTAEFFQRSDSGAAVTLVWQHMSSRPDLMMPTVDEGIRRVLMSGGDYAFVMESPVAEYEVSLRPCELRMIGSGEENDNGAAADEIASYKVLYAMATRPNSPLLGMMNRHLINMHETGYITERYSYWWRRQQHEPIRCESSTYQDDQRALEHRDSFLADAVVPDQQYEGSVEGMEPLAPPRDAGASSMVLNDFVGKANFSCVVTVFIATLFSKLVFL